MRLGPIHAEAVLSASGTPAPLPPQTPELLQQIDRVSIATLRDCMQTVFEDGPKRDRRLWIGDMWLQALTNYATFRNFELVKRCLHLFAAFPREDGLVPACVFKNPAPPRSWVFIDWSRPLDRTAAMHAVFVDVVRPGGPYLYHYVVDAMLSCGMKEQARSLVESCMELYAGVSVAARRSAVDWV